MPKLRVGLGLKLILSLVGSLVIIFGTLTFWSNSAHQDQLQRVVIDAAMRIADTIDQSLQHDMLRKECAEAFDLIYTIAAGKGIVKIRIFDSQGKIEYSTDKTEINSYLDMDAEQCNVCHSGDEPIHQISSDKRWRIFNDVDGNRVLGLINPIWNKESCSSVDCHYHSQDKTVLGVLDVNMSLKDIDTELAGAFGWTLIAYVVTMLIVVIISGVFVIFMVHRPVKKLIEGTEFAARGYLDHKLDITSKDELGTLAQSFNRMTSDLKKARDEITEWAKTLENRVEEKTAELERAQEQILRIEKMASLGKLSAIVAHEINNPLTGVLTYAKLLQKRIVKKQEEVKAGGQLDFSECAKYLEIIESETARCGAIVKNLLTFSKKSTVHFQENDLNELLEMSIKLVNHQLELANIELERYLEPNLPSIVCDSGQIQQIFVALLINAIEAIDSGGKIVVKTFYDFVNKRVVFQIKDDGTGMDNETLKHIFEPFFSTKKGSNGSGLGLTVVYGIVERHGARISVDSAVGKGTTFTLRFALKPPVPTDEIEVPVSAPPERI